MTKYVAEHVGGGGGGGRGDLGYPLPPPKAISYPHLPPKNLQKQQKLINKINITKKIESEISNSYKNH